jgi:hypothetical protein
MTTLATEPTTHRTSARTDLWKGAGLTVAAAVLLPRVNAVMYDHEKIWRLDHEAAVLAPLVVVLALAVFAAVGPYAWRGAHNRPALGGLVAGVVAVLGVVAFFLSIPIIAGGLAVTLGLEGLRRADQGRRRMATTAAVLGSLGVVAGAVLWLVGA